MLGQARAFLQTPYPAAHGFQFSFIWFIIFFNLFNFFLCAAIVALPRKSPTIIEA
jgi:hypothetical protein